MIDRPTFIITLRPEPGVDGIVALRRLLKDAGRQYGLVHRAACILAAGAAGARRWRARDGCKMKYCMHANSGDACEFQDATPRGAEHGNHAPAGAELMTGYAAKARRTTSGSC
jgi:hypothetical protein